MSGAPFISRVTLDLADAKEHLRASRAMAAGL
jgi:hypothetical protein